MNDDKETEDEKFANFREEMRVIQEEINAERDRVDAERLEKIKQLEADLARIHEAIKKFLGEKDPERAKGHLRGIEKRKGE
jgi:histidinol dehydrogenase